MIRLQHHREPYWLDLVGGVRVLVLPFTTAIMLAVRGAGEDLASPNVHVRDAAAVRAYGRAAILDWEGVQAADGTPAPPTPDNIDAVLDIGPVGAAFHLAYVNPGLDMALEKNGSAPSPSGTSAGVSTTAVPAAAPAPSARPN